LSNSSLQSDKENTTAAASEPVIDLKLPAGCRMKLHPMTNDGRVRILINLTDERECQRWLAEYSKLTDTHWITIE